MGADQSLSKRTDGTYSITKSIDDRISRGQLGRGNREQREKKHDIVIVKEGTVKEDEDPALKKLSNIPVFLPILQSSIGSSSSIFEQQMLEKMDTKALAALCQRYQDHLKHCAEAVSFDQNALCVRIKEIDFSIQNIYSVLQERQKRYAKYAEQIQKVSEMHSVLNKVKLNVEQTLPIMERLNSVLPPDNQLEPFSMKPQQT